MSAVNMIKQLLSPDPLGFTAMHYAAFLGKSDAVRSLVQEGFDLNAVTRRGVTPLDCARFSAQASTIIYLRELGARPSPCGAAGLLGDGYGKWLESFALHYAKFLDRFIHALRTESIRRKAMIVNPSVPMNSGRLYPNDMKSDDFDYRKWREDHVDEIAMHRNRILREVREKVVEKQIGRAHV